MVAKTVLEIITMVWVKAGNTGFPTPAFVKSWRAANQFYGRHPLTTRFGPGSTMPSRPLTRLDRATRAWIALGRPSPAKPDFDRDAFEVFLSEFRDEYDLYDDTAPVVPAAPK